MATHFEGGAYFKVKMKHFVRYSINHYYQLKKYTVWSEKDLRAILDYPDDVDELDPAVMEVLHEWESEGVIRLAETRDCLFEVLKPFEDTGVSRKNEASPSN